MGVVGGESLLTIDVREYTGRVLCCTIFRPGGRKLLAKGHVLSEEDVRLLETEGLGQVWVTELEEGEIGEDEAVSQAAAEMGCGCLEIRLAAGGRANLFATQDCCILVDDELLRQINCTSSIVIATTMNFGFAKAGQRVATVKSSPFAVARAQLETVKSILRERGPILQARPIRKPNVAVLYTDPVQGGTRAAALFDNTPHAPAAGALCNHACVRDERDRRRRGGTGRALQHLDPRETRRNFGHASTTAPAGARGCNRPGDAPDRLPPGAIPGSGRAGEFIPALL